MRAFETMFQACCEQITILMPPEDAENASSIEALCTKLTSVAIVNHVTTGVLDFEQIVSVDMAWWVYGVYYALILSLTTLLNVFSIHIFLHISMRSPTTYLLAAITVLDLLTCLVQAPLNIHAYLLERYRELPSYIWCEIYNYVHNFLPAALHSAAFLLNMFLSVQRCAGIRDIKQLRVVGTYKASLLATVLCVLFSFSIHALYPATIGIESVTAISKKVVSSRGLDYIQSCRVVPRFKDTYIALYSSYLWLRVSLLQVTPALIITVCNITLIQASYKTYAYRKRLVGALGIFTESNASSLATDDTFLTSERSCSKTATSERAVEIGLSIAPHKNEEIAQIIYTRHSMSETLGQSRGSRRSADGQANSCFRERRSVSEGICENAAINKRGSNKRFSTGNINSFSRNGKVAPLTSFSGILEEVSLDSTAHVGCRAQNRHFSICAMPRAVKSLSIDTTNLLYGCHDPGVERRTDGILQQRCKSSNLFAASRDSVQMYKESEKIYFENTRRISVVPEKTVHTLEVMRASFSHFRPAESSYVRDNLQDDRLLHQPKASFSCRSDISFVANTLRPSSSTICRNSNHSSVPSIAHSYINNRFKPLLSTQHSITSISAEVRSTIMLILVTSCTLIAEVFVVILLILLFLSNFVWPSGDLISHSDLSTAIMFSNALVSLTFPLNFVFFCGLSQAFRSALTSRLQALIGRRSQNSDQT
ncbi:unnamed protein product [Candidula unifasciata]|uniref:G-protein coupled receptors family 1 profile domain-containing protein n=1 Tax=Candidula unifasciata TaxID=100452 RepID=A0A8S3YR35_9EUPU|nr:unnamed protein product [Candidula unifasciata]